MRSYGVSLGRVVVALGLVTAAFAVVAASTGTYAVAVVLTLLAGGTSFAAFAGACFYVFTAFWAHDRELAQHRRAMLARAVFGGLLLLFVVAVWQLVTSPPNFG